jgi:ssDNA-binding Zn-finger/Zn-ribbon topoisomerase 1
MIKPIQRKRAALSCPCPRCGSPSRVRRVSRGERRRTIKKKVANYVLRERLCIGVAHHRFFTEERAR